MRRKMTREERAEHELRGIEVELALLDRIDYHRRKLIEEGRKPSTTDAWMKYHRRAVERRLERVREVLPHEVDELLAFRAA